MNDLFVSLEGVNPPANPVVGRLRQAREDAGLHIAVLATLLKVPVKKLEALEQGRYHELPDLTFARALASSACRHLKIDPAPVLAELPSMQPAVLTQMAIDDKPAYRSADSGGLASWSAPAWLRQPPVWMAAGFLVLAAVVYMWPSSPESVSEAAAGAPAVGAASSVSLPTPPLATSAPAAPETQPSASVQAPAAEPVAAVVSNPSLTSASMAPIAVGGATGAVAENAAAVVAAAEPAPATPAVPAVGGDLLLIVGTGDSWLEVVDGRGAVLLRRMLRSGEEHRFNTQPPYRVLLGNAGAARVTVRGRDFDTGPHVRNSVARFEVQ